MKRTLLLVAVLSLVITGCGKKDETAIARKGYINFLVGKVTLLDGGRSTTAKVGDAVTEGMEISTAKDASVDIYFGENAVKVMEDTRVSVKSLMYGEKGEDITSLVVQEGKMVSRVHKKLSKGDAWEVVTPTTIAGVRGTDFVVEEREGLSKVSCYDGKVRVHPASGSEEDGVDLEAGQEATVDPSGKMAVQDIKDSSRKDMEKILDDFRKMRDDLRRDFEEEKKRYQDQFEDARQESLDDVEEVRRQSQQDVQDVKDEAQEEIDRLKGNADEQRQEAADAVQSQKDANVVDTDAAAGAVDDIKDRMNEGTNMDDVKPSMDDMKPEIKKPEAPSF